MWRVVPSPVSSGLQRANSTKAVTAAVSLYPMLEELPVQSLSAMLAKQKVVDEPAEEPAEEAPPAGKKK